MAALMMLLATIGASYAANFYQLLTCFCFLGLGEGLSLTLVSSIGGSLHTHVLIHTGSPHDDRHDFHTPAT